MAETSWAERRGRMVKCKIHGLHYDPEMSTGCTRCLRDAAKAERPTRPPQLVLILLCLLGMAAIVLYLSGSSDELAGPIDLGIASEPAEAAPKLDPEPYRTPFENLDVALFRTPLDETEDLLVVSSNVRAATEDLSASILRSEPVDGLAAADEIARMGQGIPPDQVAFVDIQRARTQWTRIRKQRFLSASWFSEPSAAPTRPDTTIADYSDVAAGVRALIEDGAAEVEAMADSAAAPDAVPGEDDTALLWRTFAREWLEQLDSLESRLPARPAADSTGELLVAIQDLEQALSLARSLASSAQPPAVTDSRFDDGVDAALRAQQGFDNIAP